MSQQALEIDRQPRKQVRLHLRLDLAITPQVGDGRTTYHVKDPVSLHYYRFDEREHFLARYMDGQRTLDEIQKEYEKQFPPQRLKLEDLEAFAQQLLQNGLALSESPKAGEQLFERRQKRRRREWLQILTNVLFIKVPMFDPDRLLARILPWFGWMFAIWFVLAGAALMLAAVLLVATHSATFQSKLPDAHEFFSWQMLVYLWTAIGLVKVFHEFGHGLCCKRYGGEVHEMGVLLLCLSPSLYCNVSDASTLPAKWQRIFVSFAGIYVELLIASLATFVWWYTPGQPFFNRLSLSLIIVCSVSTLVFNANPLLRFDGYYVLADWLEIPNLREQANQTLRRVVMEMCLGMDVLPEPFVSLRRRLFFLTYAVASFLYGWAITFGILWFLYMFLKPYKLGTVGALLAGGALGLMIGRPLFQLGHNLHRRGWRLPDMKPRRVAWCTGILLALVLAFFLVPLPVSRVREHGLVQVQPEAQAKVFVAVPGTLKRLHIRDGQHVEAGDILAEFFSLELDRQYEEAQSEYDIRVVQINTLRTLAAETTDAQEKAKIQVGIAAAVGERDAYAKQIRLYGQLRQRLVLRAPCSGVILSPPKKDEVGKFWEPEQPAPFCTIGALERLQVLVPVAPADYRLIQEDGATELAVTIRVKGLDAATWRGQISVMPESEAKEVPLALTQKAGGPLAVKSAAHGNALVPQEQHYLVAVDFREADRAIRPGNLAQVKIHCQWRPLSWWVWRTVTATFDLGLW